MFNRCAHCGENCRDINPKMPNSKVTAMTQTDLYLRIKKVKMLFFILLPVRVFFFLFPVLPRKTRVVPWQIASFEILRNAKQANYTE